MGGLFGYVAKVQPFRGLGAPNHDVVRENLSPALPTAEGSCEAKPLRWGGS
ncbi:MAG: hypothetical protein AAGF89_03285 [Bacteroidota bacterium]